MSCGMEIRIWQKWILLFVFGILVSPVCALYCYTCDNESPDRNWRCNEAEPKLCQNNEVCVTIREPGWITKQCMDTCPRSRGDGRSSPCYECKKDFCNSGLSLTEEAVPRTLGANFQGIRLVLYGEFATFWQARLKCANHGGKLATIMTRRKQRFIERNFLRHAEAGSIMEINPDLKDSQSPSDINSFWIGGRRVYGNDRDMSGTWIWTDNGSLIKTDSSRKCDGNDLGFENWDKRHPPNRIEPWSLLCTSVSRSRNGSWQGISCGVSLPAYLCEFSRKGEDGVGYIQSVVADYLLYSYHSVEVQRSEATGICLNSKSSVAEPENNILDLFGYTLTEKDIWRPSECLEDELWTDKLNVWKTELPPPCAENKAFICARPFTPIGCPNVPPEEFESNSTLADEPTTASGFCDVLNIGTYSFPMTGVGEYASTESTCSNGVSVATILCRNGRRGSFFDYQTLHIPPCAAGIRDLLAEGNRNGSFKDIILEKVMDSLVNMTSFTQQPTSLNMSNAIELISILSKGSEKVAKNVFNEAIVIAGNIHDYVLRAKRNRTGFDFGISEEDKLTLITAVEKLAGNIRLDKNESGYKYNSPGIAVEIRTLYSVELEENDGEDLICLPEHSRDVAHSSIKISKKNLHRILPNNSETFDNDNGGSHSRNYRVVFMSYDNHYLFPTDEDIETPSVISATVTDGEETYSVPVKYSMQLSNESTETCVKRECKYYDTQRKIWSTDGCERDHKPDDLHNNIVSCKCDHTTSFAIVVSQHVEQNYALDVVSTTGLVVCIFCLSLTVIIFSFSAELKRVRSAPTHTNLCACLALAYFVFLIGIERTSCRPLCIAVAATIHFLLLSGWGWMAVESITMYRMFVRTLDGKGILEGPKVALVVYLSTAMIVIVTMVLSVLGMYHGWDSPDRKGCSEPDLWSLYVGENYCWLQGNALYFGFLMVIAVALIFNVVSAGFIIKAITWGRTTVQSSLDEKPFVHVIRAVLIALLLGIAWIFAVPLVISRDATVQKVFGWLFAITTFTQGVFIFYFFCLRRKEVRASWIGSVKRSFDFKSKKYEKDSTTPSTNLENVNPTSTPNTSSRKSWRRFTTSSTGERRKNTDSSSIKSSPARNITKKTTNKCEFKAKEENGVKAVGHSGDLVGFTGENVFE